MNAPFLQQHDVLIVGAGIAGLSAASRFQEAGLKVKLVDKGRGIGGRMATRRFGGGVFDHGAQFFTVRDSRFAERVSAWRKQGLVHVWDEGAERIQDRFAGSSGMTAVPKDMAVDHDIDLGVRIVTLEKTASGWKAEAESGQVYHAAALLLTPPVPQSLALIETAALQLDETLKRKLKEKEYDPCLVTLALYDKATRIPPPGYLEFDEGPVRFLADNQQKGISARSAVTIHAAPGFSREHYDASDDWVAEQLLSACAQWLPEHAADVQVKRWRYSKPIVIHDEPFAVASEDPFLILAGDAFVGPRVESAALSGRAAAEEILSHAPFSLHA